MYRKSFLPGQHNLLKPLFILSLWFGVSGILTAQDPGDTPPAEPVAIESGTTEVPTPPPPTVNEVEESAATPTAPTESSETAAALEKEVKKARPIPEKQFGPGIEDKNRQKLGRDDPSFSLWRYFISMAVVLGLMALFFWGLKRFSHGIGGQGYGSLQVLQRLQIDGKHSLVLVRYHDDEVLLAIGPNTMKVVSQTASLSGEDNEDNLEEEQLAATIAEKPSLMDKFLGKGGRL